MLRSPSSDVGLVEGLDVVLNKLRIDSRKRDSVKGCKQ